MFIKSPEGGVSSYRPWPIKWCLFHLRVHMYALAIKCSRSRQWYVNFCSRTTGIKIELIIILFTCGRSSGKIKSLEIHWRLSDWSKLVSLIGDRPIRENYYMSIMILTSCRKDNIPSDELRKNHCFCYLSTVYCYFHYFYIVFIDGSHYFIEF